MPNDTSVIPMAAGNLFGKKSSASSMGAIRAAGWDGEAAWKEVMDTNFAKIDAETGKVIKRSDGKVLKPVGWTAPQLAQFVGGK